MKYLTIAAILISASLCAAAADFATIEGTVLDKNTGKSMPNIKVNIYKAEDHDQPQATALTDPKGYYSANVTPGSYYDVYLVIGDANPNLRTTHPVEASGTYTLNFRIDAETSYTSSVVEKYGIGLVAAVAGLIIALIIVDQLLLRRKTQEPGIDELRKKRDQIQEMVNLAKTKYHKREIDEESFREITRDHQQKLIEIESKIKYLENK
jgi:hypothetical protein